MRAELGLEIGVAAAKAERSQASRDPFTDDGQTSD
jgi:hypothetical protein